MEDGAKKRRLGKGLSELLGEVRMQAQAQMASIQTTPKPADILNIPEMPQENIATQEFIQAPIDINTFPETDVSESYQELPDYAESFAESTSREMSFAEQPQTQDSGKNPPVAQAVFMVPIEYIDPNPKQPRTDFPADELQNLALSIQEFGILQPLLVAKKPDSDHYLLIAGERRWRASQLAGLKEVPVMIKEYNMLEISHIALIENIQRMDLSPLEEAAGYAFLLNQFDLTQHEIATRMGKSRSHIANMLRLLSFDSNMRQLLHTKQISLGHAKVLLGLPEDVALRFAKESIDKNVTVRDLERRVNMWRMSQEMPSHTQRPAFHRTKDTDTLALEADLAAALGLKVDIQVIKAGKGQLIVHYNRLEELDEVCKRLCQAVEV